MDATSTLAALNALAALPLLVFIPLVVVTLLAPLRNRQRRRGRD